LIDAPVRYFHTLRHLRLRQWVGRVWHLLPKPAPHSSLPPSRYDALGRWDAPLWRSPSLVGPTEFSFAGETRSVLTAADWRCSDMATLWLYNLHYFDDLDSVGAELRAAWHGEWIRRWINGNPMGVGVGWDPYPTSLRIVNWIKWALRGGSLPDGSLASLALQTRWLERRLETHLLGNHLWTNAKALCFAGAFFEGEEARKWSALGRRLVERELVEQCLEDGGHFERSPMYHGIFLEDVLDLLRLCQLRPTVFPFGWPSMLATTARRMTDWMSAMVHPDGDIAFFNDATLGVSAPLDRLFPDAVTRVGGGMHHLAASGFLRMRAGEATLFADVGGVGPDHLPGHAHAGTLSFELSLGVERVIVNSGVSRYGVCAERLRQRGTRAHSTLVVDGADSSEVWSGFRVARRARVIEFGSSGDSGLLRFWAVHDGYRRLAGSPLHKRTWSLESDSLSVEDEVVGAGRHRLEIVFRLAPAWRAERIDAFSIRIRLADASADEERDLILTFGSPFEAVIEQTSWHPGFGVSLPASAIVLYSDAELPCRHATRIGWHRA
jgi:uncharacterized heparinase superfamily protein